MSKRKLEARRIFDPLEGHTHYEADSHSGNVTLCGQTDWLDQSERGYETDRLVDCVACVRIVEFIHSCNFKGTACV